MTLDEMKRFIAPLQRRVMLAIGRGTLGPVNDADGLQRSQVKLLAGEVRDNVERMQQYGISAVPLAGADVLVVCVGGNRDHPVIIGVDDRRHRPTGLQPGDVCIYSYQSGHRIILKADRKIEIEGDEITVKADTKITLEAPVVEMTGRLDVMGDIRDQAASGGMSMNGMRADYNTHVHGMSPGPNPLMQP
ncbi:MAG: phage baseplate assembly protein V [Roseomonas sp.]|nr:phage baseplate assembly protein V [Roseomonas sp.]